MNYYERHLGDYARDTAHLTLLEHGAYTVLLDRYYATALPLPAAQVHRWARARSADEVAAVDAVLAEFFVLVDGAWTNRRVEEELTKAQARIDAARENGKRGGRPKTEPKANPAETQPFPEQNPAETQIEAHHLSTYPPIQPEAKAKATPRQVAEPDGFAEFWAAYPVKKGKADAVKAWAKLKLDQDGVEFVLYQLRQQVERDDDWLRGFAPHPATYLNGARWNDAIAQPKRAASATQPSKTLQAIMALGEPHGMAGNGNTERVPQARLSGPGPAAGARRPPGNGDGMGGSFDA